MKLKVAMILATLVSLSVLASAQEKGCPVACPVANPTNQVGVKCQAICPIMGGAINKAKYVDQDGARIYVCCGGCVDAVKKDFATIKAKLEKDGITLEKTPVKAVK